MGHLEALLACRPCHKTQRVYILNKCPCLLWCSPLRSFPFKKKKKNSPTRCLGHLTLTGSMKKSLSPWPAAINSISHSSLCLSFLSFFRQIHLHERPLILARRPPGKWESNQRFHAILPSPSYVRCGCGKCIINKSAPFPWLKGSTCFNYPAVIWTRSALCSVTQIFHQRASEINTALCVQGAVRGQGETQSDSVFVFPSVWVSPYLSCMAHVVEQKDSVCWQVWTCVYLISYSSADIKGSEDKKICLP